MRVLVTGGAGYIGSITSKVLLARGHSVRVYDNLTSGHRGAVPAEAEFVDGDLHQKNRLFEALGGVDAVVHFAGLISVAESVREPARYYLVNAGGTQALLDAVAGYGRLKALVFSSSAAVYGEPDFTPVHEGSSLLPVNPYGETKLLCERMIATYAHRFQFRSVALRYFNAAGAAHGNGEVHDPETHLLPNVVDAALGYRPLAIYGLDYPTPDGSCVRDYVHVEDLAEAHALALEKNIAGAFNLGGGRGYSNLQVVEAVEKAAGKKIEYERAPRRAGDPAVLVASIEHAYKELGWRPTRDLDVTAADALAWRAAHPRGYAAP